MLPIVTIAVQFWFPSDKPMKPLNCQFLAVAHLLTFGSILLVRMVDENINFDLITTDREVEEPCSAIFCPGNCSL